MNIKQIESFIVLSEELHYSKAAERLGISQPSLSQQIKVLEHSLNVVLFKKKGRRIYLTKAGWIFLQRAAKIYHELILAKEEMRYFQGQKRDSIHLGVSGSHLLSAAFQPFTDRFPDVSLHVSDFSTCQTIKKILDHQIDIGIVYQTEEFHNLTAELLFEEQFVAAIPCSHELAEKKTIYLEDLENQPLILLEKEFHLRHLIDDEMNKRHIVPNVICELSNHYACLEYGKSQLGIVLTVESFVRGKIERMVVKKIKDFSLKNKVFMIHRKEMQVDSPTKFLMNEIRTAVL